MRSFGPFRRSTLWRPDRLARLLDVSHARTSWTAGRERVAMVRELVSLKWRIERKSESDFSDEQVMSQEPNRPRSQPPEPLMSEFAQDGDMIEIIQRFLDELPSRMSSIHMAMETEDEDRLRRMAHQLKSAAAGYGFPSITESAAMIEQTLLEHEADLSLIEERVEDLLTLCQRALRGGKIDSGTHD